MKILVGYDGSGSSNDAVQLAKQYAIALNAGVHVAKSHFGGTGEEAEKIQRSEHELKQVETQFEDTGISCRTHLLIRGMSPGEDLAAFAAENDIELIVIGVRRRSRMNKLVFGSTAQYVILNAPCPVLTVK